MLDSARNESMPSISAHGTTLVYVTDRRGGDEAWAEDLDKRRAWPVLSAADFALRTGPPFFFIAPALSPDARRVAVSMVNPAGPRIWITGLETPAPVRLTAEEAIEFAPTWSPDGQWIAYDRRAADGRRTIAKARLGSSAAPVDLLENPDFSALPEWSPTSEWIACAALNKPGITLVSPDGKTTRYLPGESAPLAWAPEGKTIYQVRGSQPPFTLAAIDAASGKARVIREVGDLRPVSPLRPGWRMAVSSGGKSLVWSVSRSRSEVWVLHGLRAPRPWYSALFGPR